MEVKGSEAQGRHRAVGSEGSVEQRYGPMDKNWMGGLRRRTSEQLIAKSVSIKDAGGQSGGRVSKVDELIARDLRSPLRATVLPDCAGRRGVNARPYRDCGRGGRVTVPLCRFAFAVWLSETCSSPLQGEGFHSRNRDVADGKKTLRPKA
jgi:hypothetical protein